MLVIQHFRHCSEQKLARQGEVKELERRCFLNIIFLLRRRSKSQVKTEEMSFQVSFENCQGLSIPDGGGKSFHQPGTLNENILEGDFVPLCDGTTRHRTLADLRLLEGL